MAVCICDNERCPHCGEQLLSCCCDDDYDIQFFVSSMEMNKEMKLFCSTFSQDT